MNTREIESGNEALLFGGLWVGLTVRVWLVRCDGCFKGIRWTHRVGILYGV